MRSATRAGFRIAGLVAMTFLIAHCGDSSVHIRTGRGVTPSPGTFTGDTDEGGSIVVVVDSIRSIAFQCDSDPISQTFEPPAQIDSDGTFSVKFTDAGRKFHVTGTFTDQNTLEGFIDDENNHCDTGFTATRGGVTPPTSTPHPTPTGVHETATSEPTTVGVTPTVGETPTGGVLTPTPTQTSGAACPSKVTIEGQGDQADLDSGWTGIAMNTKVINKGSLTVALDCHGNSKGSCGSCDVSGPIASTTVVNNRRCSNDTSKTCTADGDCSGGTCAFIFGAPLPLSSGGVPVCVTNRVDGAITGTANPDTGSGASTANLISAVFTGLTVDQPCPRCSGAGFNQAGTCSGGDRNGLACTVHGTSAQFGNTSLDCPPTAGANIGNLSIALNPTTGTSTLSPSKTCTSIPFNGKACYCQGQKQANACDDAICTDPNGTGGTCTGGPFDQFCSIQTFRGCLSDADCPAGAGNCQGAPTVRPCSGQTDSTTFAITNAMKRVGTASPTNPTLASTFCIAATSSGAVNAAGGLPGPGGLVLPGKACYTDSCTF
jgi:hypothetical protein